MAGGLTFGGFTILSSPLFVQEIFPFLLVFALTFAVLQKTKILGENVSKINAIISLVVGLLVISFAYPVSIIIQLVPFLAVSLVIILVFLLMWGFISSQNSSFKISNGFILGMGTLFFLAVVIAVLIFTGAWDYILNYIGGGGGELLSSIVIILAVVGAIVFILQGLPSGGSGDKKKE